MNKTTIALALVASLMGCAQYATLQVRSQPIGAQIKESESGRIFGTAPITISYDIKKLKAAVEADGCYRVKGLTAEWASGATASTQGKVTMCGGGTNFNYQFNRPDYPGLDKDLAMANQKAAIDAQERQAAAAEAAANAQIYNATTPIVCKSTSLFGNVTTVCN